MPLMASDGLVEGSDGGGDVEEAVKGSGGGSVKAVALYTCEVCGRGFRRRSNLSRHQRLHSGERPYECPQCCRLFAHHSSLRHHLRLHTGERPYQCSVCLRTFRQRPNYSLHLKTHTGEKGHRCLACGKEFAQRVHLTAHARLHSGDLPYACQDCGRRFSQRCHLTRHRGTRGGKAEHPCHLCGRNFLSRSCLSSHLETHEGGTHLKQQCRPQQKQQDNEEGVSGVRSKVQAAGGGRGRIRAMVECEVCHKTFHKPSHLRHHRYTHTGERPYPCPQCGRRFSEAGSLRRHMTSHIRAHLKHTLTRTTSTLIHEVSNINQYDEAQERGVDSTNTSESAHNSGELQGETAACTSPHHLLMSSHNTIDSPHHLLVSSHNTTENTGMVLRQDNAMYGITNTSSSSDITVHSSNKCFDEDLADNKNAGEDVSHLKTPLTSQATASPLGFIKQTKKVEKHPHDTTLPSRPLSDQNFLSNPQDQLQKEDKEGNWVKTDNTCSSKEDLAGYKRTRNSVDKEEYKTDHTDVPDSLPLTHKPLVAVSLFLFGKKVKEEAGIEEQSVKEELELIEEAV